MRSRAFGALVALMWLIPGPGLAHGIGGRQDLPVPVEFFVAGAGVVLVISFLALAFLWPNPRLQSPVIERTIQTSWWKVVRAVLGAVGTAGLLIVVVAGFIGEPSASANPAPALVFVAFWLIVPFLSALIGDIYPDVDPWRRLRDLFGIESDGHRPVGSLLPATGALLAFTWLELVSPVRDPVHLGIAAVVYSSYVVGMGLAGRRSADIDGFAVYNRLFGAMAPVARSGSGTMIRRGWLRALPHIPEQRGLVAFVVVMIGTVTYDGASFNDWWGQSIELPMSRVFFEAGLSATTASALAGTIGFLGVSALIGGAYLLASWAAARLGGRGTARQVASRFAHTLVPIAFAYAFAHYFTLILFEGQLMLSTMSDPFGLGWDLFGTADRPISYDLITGSATWVWYVQVAVIVFGHIAGVVLAHDRALADFEPERAVNSQYAMLMLMLMLTGLGLVILASG
jgi:hypothetical protein